MALMLLIMLAPAHLEDLTLSPRPCATTVAFTVRRDDGLAETHAFAFADHRT